MAVRLRQHPSVEVVSRVRAGAFADAIAKGAPRAAQVADRWHLLNNLVDTLMRSLKRHRGTLAEVAEKSRRSTIRESAPVPEPTTQALLRKKQIREQRMQRYEELKRLLDQGSSQIGGCTSLRHATANCTALADGVFPERKHRVFTSTVDPYGPHLEGHYREGCRSMNQLWQEAKQMGFNGQVFTVRAWLCQRFGSPKNRAQPLLRRSVPVSPQRIAWLMLKADTVRHRYLKALYRYSPEIAGLGQIARKLFEILRNHDAAAWPDWLDTASRSPFVQFARRMERDKDAIAAALKLPWSNGMVEGQIHRLKLIKWQMYGKANFDLLRLRVLQSA